MYFIGISPNFTSWELPGPHIGPKKGHIGSKLGHKRTSRTLNRDLKVTKPGPNDQPECISLASVQFSPHGSYQGPSGPYWSKKGPYWSKLGHKRTSRTLNRDLKVTKLGPNDQPECISLESVQISLHGSYQGPSGPLRSKKAILVQIGS